MKKKISITVNELILKNIDSTIDNLIVRNRSQAIEIMLSKMLDNSKAAAILLGGPEGRLKIGNQFVSLVKINKTTLIERGISKLRENNFREIYIIGRKKILNSIFSVINDGHSHGVKINYIEEKVSNGTADSLRLLKNKLSKPFLVVYGDIIFDKIRVQDIWDHHMKHKPLCTIMLTTFKDPSIKGEVILKGEKVIEFNQKPKKASSYLVFSPIFVCEPEILQHAGSTLEKDIFPLLAQKQLLSGYTSPESEMHIHKKSDLGKAKKYLGKI